MFFRLVILISILVVTISCDFISPKRTTLRNEMPDTEIDFNEVDVYPLFMDCNNCDTSEKQNLCFEMELIRRLQKITDSNRLGSSKLIRDTIMVDILVDTKGKISISKIHENQNVNQLLPELDSLLYRSIAELPAAVQPSLKRGIPVNSMFRLPIVVSPKR